MHMLLDEGEQIFGSQARARYAALLVQAMQDIANDPDTPASRRVSGVEQSVRFYHIRFSKERVADPPGRVGEPRHILVYQVAPDGVVEILGCIPDRMTIESAIISFIPEL
jgi:toxin ParE1/3/4